MTAIKPQRSSNDEQVIHDEPVVVPTSQAGEAPPQPSEAPKEPWPELSQLLPNVGEDAIKQIINGRAAELIEKSNLLNKYSLLFLFELGELTADAADRIYSSLADLPKDKPILLMICSPGGYIGPAYFIAKLCREHTKQHFEVVVPRWAKSAATLICCGADKIHMGSLSQLGPIDPQFEDPKTGRSRPALALKNSIEHIAQLVTKYPAASGMLSDYLAKSLELEDLGYFERVAESAQQYAEHLLNSRLASSNNPANLEIAKHLVYDYKDHSFVIDSRQATEIFGNEVVVNNTEEYNFSNALWEPLSYAYSLCETKFNRNFSYIGDAKNGCRAVKKEVIKNES
jgi:hypothetical protein